MQREQFNFYTYLSQALSKHNFSELYKLFFCEEMCVSCFLDREWIWKTLQ